MKHRHLKDDVGLTAPAIDDILENGSPEDWNGLFNDVERDPFGEIAEKVLRLCTTNPTLYGTRHLWPEMIRMLRDDA